MDHLLRWLVDVAVTAAFIYWQRSRERPALRLVPRSATPVKRIVPARTGLVAVLVSQPAMEQQVLRALGDYTTLRFTKTWAELQEVVMRRSPSAIVADPLADRGGHPEPTLDRFSHLWRIPVVLYTHLSPEGAHAVFALGQSGIRHVIFWRVDDDANRFIEVVPWVRDEPPLHAA